MISTHSGRVWPNQHNTILSMQRKSTLAGHRPKLTHTNRVARFRVRKWWWPMAVQTSFRFVDHQKALGAWRDLILRPFTIIIIHLRRSVRSACPSRHFRSHCSHPFNRPFQFQCTTCIRSTHTWPLPLLRRPLLLFHHPTDPPWTSIENHCTLVDPLTDIVLVREVPSLDIAIVHQHTPNLDESRAPANGLFLTADDLAHLHHHHLLYLRLARLSRHPLHLPLPIGLIAKEANIVIELFVDRNRPANVVERQVPILFHDRLAQPRRVTPI